MTRQMSDLDNVLRETLKEERIDGFDALDEPGLPDTVTAVFSGKMRWYGAAFLFMIIVFTGVGVYCGYRFVVSDDVTAMLRWGAGLFLGVIAVQGGKTWYWMQLERLAMTREIKRVELLVAQLALEVRSR
jgi:hypothetical protein